MFVRRPFHSRTILSKGERFRKMRVPRLWDVVIQKVAMWIYFTCFLQIDWARARISRR